MRTGSRIWRGFLCGICLLGATGLFAQTNDTTSNRPFVRYWTKPLFIPKLGAGFQDRAFAEIGIQWHSIYKHPLTLVSKGPYCTVDLFIKDNNALIGPKVGYEFTAGLVGVAADVTYFMDHSGEGGVHNAWVATPKIGLSILGFANLFYGYSIPLGEELNNVSRNRFSLVFNLNTYYFDLKDAPRKRSK
ncbi:hypothetical protein [Chryseolinea lacunae]|uniref:DUF3575 domain-containing protein n=1 Tax=Chryseolinea lacunae TaxID=2801331 RepID=A0ABS1KJS0_9BACT|nr:hypothetical protein [Chryseolinea lacunae]MBL0739598.1 hypothetical protein [Chryseolinea lacunae]